MGDTIKFKKGLKENLPTLGIGEPGFTTNVDDQRMYIGGPNGNVAIPNMEDIDVINSQMNDIENDVTNLETIKADKTDLIDVETGTFTPKLIGSTTEGVQTYGQQKGFYQKTGNQVHIDIVLVIDNIDSTTDGSLRITGLPFATNPTYFYRGTVAFSYNNLVIINDNQASLIGFMGQNSNFIQLAKTRKDSSSIDYAIPADIRNISGVMLFLSADYLI